MSLDSKYNNYIYLSNRPEEIKLAKDDGKGIIYTPLSLDLAVTLGGFTDEFQEYFAGLGPDFSIKATLQPGTSNDIYRDFPTYGPTYNAGISLRTKEYTSVVVPKSVNQCVNLNMSDLDPSLNNNRVISFDPLRSPNINSCFIVQDGVVKYQSAFSTAFFSPFVKSVWNWKIDYKIDVSRLFTDDIDITNSQKEFMDATSNIIRFEPVPTDPKRLPKTSHNTSLVLISEDGYLYSQDDYINFVWGGTDNEHFQKQSMKTFFRTYKQALLQQTSEGAITDVTTRIGVPFDYETIINNDLNLKSYGVKNTTPEFKKIYNYYDPQYEPVVTALIDDNPNGINELSLPSVYDFIYFPVQEAALKNVLNVPGFKANGGFKLSNLNRYLDAFSANYNRYFSTGLNQMNIYGVISTYFYKGQGQKGPKVASVFGKDQQVEAQNVTQEDEKNLFFNDKSEVIKNINGSFGSAGALDGTGYLSKEKQTSVPLWIQQIKQGIYFSEKSMDYFNQTLESDSAFPFYTKINIPTEQRGPITSLLSENNLLDSINSHIASTITPNPNVPDVARSYSPFYGGLINGLEDKTKHMNLFTKIELQTFMMHFVNKSEVDPEEVYDSDLFLDTFRDIGLHTPKNVFVYTDKPNSLVAEGTGLPQLLQQVKADTFTKKLNRLFFDKKLLRSPREIRDGKLAHQETLMYEIAKYSVNEDGVEEYLQSIFLPTTQQENLSYYDTQIVPYKDYLYKIFTHKVIVGTKYSMGVVEPESDPIAGTTSLQSTEVVDFVPRPTNAQGPSYGNDGGNYMKVRYDVKPVLQFVRVPYYNTEAVNIKVDEINYTRVEDAPPLPPDVNIVPFRNVNDKILIMLNINSGEVEAYPKLIFPEDKIVFDKVARSQERLGKTPQKLLFRSDDQIGTYQIYRTLNKPTDYLDISKDPTLVEYSIEEDYLFDDITPNVNYYYTFRFLDIHNKVSNPTYVYKIKMIQSTGLPPYLTIETLDVTEEKRKKNEEKFLATKSLRKYLMIRPNDFQNEISYPSLQYDKDDNPIGDPQSLKVAIGNAEGESVFGNTYKLRLTSRQTGKKIDINFTVKTPLDIINDL